MELPWRDVRVTSDCGQVSVAEVLGYEPGVARALAEPRGRCVAQRLGGDSFLESSPLGGTADDVRQDRWLKAAACESSKDGLAR